MQNHNRETYLLNYTTKASDRQILM